jgi:hypothetical protein
MKSSTRIALLTLLFCLPSQQPLLAQACQDMESMVGSYTKGITELVDTVKKESLEDFQKAYHQKNCLTKLTLCLNIVNQVVDCYAKAAQDTMATKEQVDAAKAKRESYARLKAKVEQDRNNLKATEAAKDAKALIAKIDLSN